MTAPHIDSQKTYALLQKSNNFFHCKKKLSRHDWQKNRQNDKGKSCKVTGVLLEGFLHIQVNSTGTLAALPLLQESRVEKQVPRVKKVKK